MKQLSFLTFLSVILLGFVAFGSCKDEIDQSDMYVFTGKTVTSFLDENPDDYSNFTYILKQVKLSPKSQSTVYDLLSARGNYTLFVPDNQAVQSYLDSIYQQKDYDITILPDSMAEYIVRNSIIDNKQQEAYLSTDFFTGALETTNMNDRYITISFDTLPGGSTATYVNEKSRITTSDIEVTNGVLHRINHVLELSSATLPALLAQTENTKIFSYLLDVTAWTDSMQRYRDDWYEYNRPETIKDGDNNSIKTPEHRYYGYTAFVETDEIFHEKWGIDMPVLSDNGLVTNYATILRQIEEKCKEYYDGTDTDYRSQDNPVNQFVSYHLIKARIPLDKLVIHYAEMGYSFNNPTNLSIDCFEYYETMGKQRRLIKLTEGKQTEGKRINRYVSKRNLKTYEEEFVPIPGILIGESNEGHNLNALNGFYYPIDDILLYTDDVVNKVLNERIRFDISSIIPELITNGYRRLMSNVNSNGTAFPSSYFEDFKYDHSTMCYKYYDGYATTWPDYQGDEHNITGQYDFTFKLPPVPFEGTWEIRWAVPTFDNRGMAQFYFGENPDNLKAIGLPVDLRLRPTNPSIAWEADDPDDEDHNNENDKIMRNHGYMKPPMHDGITRGGVVTESLRNTESYRSYLRLRKIIYTGTLSPGKTYYLRCKSVLENTKTQFVMDWLEYAPKNVYANDLNPEDKW